MIAPGRMTNFQVFLMETLEPVDSQIMSYQSPEGIEKVSILRIGRHKSSH